MAKAEGFKNKIIKAQEDLFKALETEKEKKNGLFTKLVAELAKQNKANVKSLNSLNKEYVELCKQNTNSLNEFISINPINCNNKTFHIFSETKKLSLWQHIQQPTKELHPAKQW